MADSTTPLRDRLSSLIEEHKKAAAYCMTYNNLAAWLHTMIAASPVALSAAQQANSDRSLGIALIVLTAVTTTISFWQNICRFASRFAAHSTAISRYRTLLARTNNLARIAPEELGRRLDELLTEKEEATRSAPSIPPWITGKLYGLKLPPWANVGVGLSICLLFFCSFLCGNPTTAEDAQVERAEAGAATHTAAPPDKTTRNEE